jgi:hypothetical protein
MRAWLVYLYPRAWRRRYGDEFSALLEQQALTPATVVDIAWGALDARWTARHQRGARVARLQRGQGRESGMKRKPLHTCCSFCGKAGDAVRRLIAGPRVYICDECITLCNKIIADQEHSTPAAPTQNPGGLSSRPKGPWWQHLSGRQYQVLLQRKLRPESGFQG